VREFSREDERKLCIVFDNPPAGEISGPAYERAVILAASLGWHFSSQAAEVSFILPGHGRAADLHQFLARLAVIEPRRSPHARPAPRAVPEEDVLREISSASTGEYNIILTARPRGSLPSALWNSSYFVFLGEDAESRQ